MNKMLCLGLALSTALLAPGSARADLILESTQADYSANSTGNTTINFNGVVGPSGLKQYKPPTYTQGGVNFAINTTTSNGSLFSLGPGYSPQYYGAGPVLSSQLSTTGVNNLVITLPGAYTSFAVDINSDHYSTQTTDPLTFTLSTGDSFSITPPTTSSYLFQGVTSTESFTTITITDSDHDGYGLINLHDFTFGTATIVPEPSSLVLGCVAATMGLAIARRRRRRERRCDRTG